MIDPNEVKRFIGILNELEVSYFVSGGIGLDGIRGHFSRDHDDLDIYLMAHEVDSLFQILKEQGYRCFRKLNKYEVQSAGIKVDVLPLDEEEGTFYLKGNIADTRFPKEIFDKPLEGSIEGLVFPVVPAEIFALEMLYSKYPEDKQRALEIPYDRTLFSRIENIQKEVPVKIPLEEL